MAADMYKAHGELCASHPWEVIVATLMLTAVVLSIDGTPGSEPIRTPLNQDNNAVDIVFMTAVRCLAVLYSYHRFCNIHKLGSKYLLGIAGMFTVFSSFVFCSSVINFLRGEISDLKDALFFFLLLTDLPKTTLLARFALSASNRKEVTANIARGLSLLGPGLTLDTVVETLVITVGTLSGIRRLEVLCCFACLSLIINYIVFMTFYPACLSLMLELKHRGKTSVVRRNECLVFPEFEEHNQKPNPVAQRVKIIMSAALVVVHLRSHWALKADDRSVSSLAADVQYNATDNSMADGNMMRWLTLSVDRIVVFILLSALALKFVFFEDKEDLISAEKATRRLDKDVQTEGIPATNQAGSRLFSRSIDECLAIYNADMNAVNLYDEEVQLLVKHGYVSAHQLEHVVNRPERGVKIRRRILGSKGGFSEAIEKLPYNNYDYSKVVGACCENVVGYVPVPLGIAGPLLLDGELFHVPMATTEGCLVASTSRGCKAVSGSGVTSRQVADGMTRGPVIRFPSIARASEAMSWIESKQNFDTLKQSFDSTSRYARLIKLNVRIAGRHLFVRFVATTGDAMGMNMVSKGAEAALDSVRKSFPDMEILSLSGNYCADKKPAAVNWIEGRGKSVVCEAVVSADVVHSVLKTSVQALVDLNIAKNLIGSSISGSIGGFNAHAANIVTAIYIATGQDPAQNVVSSNCMTLMEPWGDRGQNLYVSCSMPSIEIGTIGGGTQLPAQAASLEILGVQGAHRHRPGDNASKLARIVCATVLAGELSLMAALASGHLVNSHLKYNRSSTQVK